MAEQLQWSDLDRQFNLDGKGDIKVARNTEAVRQSILNIMETLLGQRVMLVSFASTAGINLFEPLDELLRYQFAVEIKDTVEKWDDRVSVQEVIFNPDPEHGFADVTVRFAIVGYSQIFAAEKRFLQ